MAFFLGALFGAGVLLSFWDYRFLIPVVLIFLIVIWVEVNARPGKKNNQRAREILKEFKDDVWDDFENIPRVTYVLSRYPVRYLCYLRDGIKLEIFHSSGSDMIMSGKEEEMMNNHRQRYEELLEKVEKYIPEKYR